MNRILDTVSLYIEEFFSRNTKDTLVVKPLLLKDKTGDERILLWNYRYVKGIENYLSSSPRPDISIAVHQVACFSTELKRSYKKAIIRIARYLKCTAKFGIFYKVNLSKGIEVYVDADFTRA